MKYLLVALLLAVATSAGALAQTTAMSPTMITPDDVKWTAGTGPFAGAQIAVVYGNPEKPGPYIMRLKAPDGFKVAPHTHADTENVTVLQGALLLGVGDSADPSKAKELPAGSFFSVPKGLHHYAMTKGDTIIEISAMGPRSMTMVKPK